MFPLLSWSSGLRDPVGLLEAQPCQRLAESVSARASNPGGCRSLALATPCQAPPIHATPRHTEPSPALPRHVAWGRRSRTSAKTVTPSLPCRTEPCDTAPRPDQPRHAMPIRAKPCHSVPHPAGPSLAGPIHAKWRGAVGSRTPLRPSTPVLATPHPDEPRLTRSSPAWPRRDLPRRAEPCLAACVPGGGVEPPLRPSRSLAVPSPASPGQAAPCPAKNGPASPRPEMLLIARTPGRHGPPTRKAHQGCWWTRAHR